MLQKETLFSRNSVCACVYIYLHIKCKIHDVYLTDQILWNHSTSYLCIFDLENYNACSELHKFKSNIINSENIRQLPVKV